MLPLNVVSASGFTAGCEQYVVDAIDSAGLVGFIRGNFGVLIPDLPLQGRYEINSLYSAFIFSQQTFGVAGTVLNTDQIFKSLDITGTFTGFTGTLNYLRADATFNGTGTWTWDSVVNPLIGGNSYDIELCFE